MDRIKNIITAFIIVSLLAAAISVAAKKPDTVNSTDVVEKEHGKPTEIENKSKGKPGTLPSENKSKGQQAIVALNNSLTKGNASNESIQARLRNIERKQIHVEWMLNKSAQEKEKLEDELENMSEENKSIYKNQNRVRETVHMLLALRNFTDPGIGQNVSAIARNFNNSVKNTTAAEVKIRGRGSLMRTLFGGDDEAAEDIEEELNDTEDEIEELEDIVEQLDPDVKDVVQAQLQEMKAERARLKELAKEEKKSKGLLGWLLKI